MVRRQLLVLVVAVSAGAIGCAHCDTCDDFPVPCSGANCGGPGVPVAPVVEMPGSPILMAPGAAVGATAPEITSQPGPFAQPTSPTSSNPLPGGESPPAPKQ